MKMSLSCQGACTSELAGSKKRPTDNSSLAYLSIELWFWEDLALQRCEPACGQNQHDAGDRNRLSAVRPCCLSNVMSDASPGGRPRRATATLRQLRRDCPSVERTRHGRSGFIAKCLPEISSSACRAAKPHRRGER